MDFHLTFLQKAYIPAVAALERVCFSDPWSEGAFELELENTGGRFVLAVNDENLVLGYIGMHIVLDEGHIANLAVDPLFRKKGVAAALLADAQSFAKKSGLAFLTLEVRQSNLPAQNLYHKFGFVPVGARPRYYQNPEEDALLMTWYTDKGENA